MLNLDNLKKQAKLLVRWHRDGNYSVGGRIRTLPRYRELTDVEALALKFPLSEAQKIIALDAGYASWAALKAGLASAPKRAQPVLSAPAFRSAKPVIFVSNVQASAALLSRQAWLLDRFSARPSAVLRVGEPRRRLPAPAIRPRTRFRSGDPGEREPVIGLLGRREHQRPVRGIQGGRRCLRPTAKKRAVGRVGVHRASIRTATGSASQARALARRKAPRRLSCRRH